MKKSVTLAILMPFLVNMVIGCSPNVSPAATPTVRNPTPTSPEPTPTSPEPTPTSPEPTPTVQGKILIVTDSDNDGHGSLRQTLQQAAPGDTIVFDPAVFPANAPTVIYLETPLAGIGQGYITVDASDVGVVLDGSKIPHGWANGIEVVSSSNIIRGLQVVNFAGAGIVISRGQDNLIEKNISCGNDYGIGLWGTATSDNKIAGNHLGASDDGVTPQGNKRDGIAVWEGANNNSIGPDNHIAFNGYGVEIVSANTIGNRIFENSIHDNTMDGICLVEGGNENLAAPVLMDFDLATGGVAGVACPNCEVMVYSDARNEGSQFEGKTTADNQGVFLLEKGSAFSGPVLTATAIDKRGNTSAFSAPTVGSHTTMQLQVGNIQPRVLLETKPSDDLEENHLGAVMSNFWQPGDWQYCIEHEIVPMGLKHLRMTINEAEWVTTVGSGLTLDWSKPELSIPSELDNFVTELVSHDITIHYMLSFWDKANHPNGWEVQSRFKTEEEIARYLEYVRFIVSHFKGRVHYYELWNEPNAGYPLQYIESADYVNLAKRTIPVINEIDPEAKIIVGSTSGSHNPDSREYLFEILNSDVVPLVDAISWHPLYSDIPNSGRYPEYYANYPSLLAEIVGTAKQNGFQGEFIACEITYPGPGCGGCDINDPSFSDIVSAKYTARGIILHLGNDVIAGAGGTSSVRAVHYSTIRSIANVFAGASAEEFAVEVQTEAENFKVFTFTRTDASKLVALWTDGVAVDDDPGVSSAVTIPDFEGWNVTGIDMLKGFEQNLVASNENGNLVIRGLLIKDYPTIILLSK